MEYYRQNIVSKVSEWLGASKGSATHKQILDIYNSYKPLPRGVKMLPSYAWCCATVSAAAIACGYTAIIPIECSCGKFISLAKAMGIWVEDDAYVPKPGDFILYSWNDNGKGECTSGNDHIGTVELVSSNRITVIEGNYNNKVQRRTIAVNGRYIRGFVTPKYTDVAVPQHNSANRIVKDDALVWDILYKDIKNEYGVAGAMGNLRAESVVRSNNLQDACAARLQITDEAYTEQVNRGIRNFLDNCGYGIAQWTSASRKKNLQNYLKNRGLSIDDLTGQTMFLLEELKKTYPTTYKVLCNAKSVREASDRFMYYYEAPKNRDSQAVKDARCKYSQDYYETYAKNKVFEEYHIAVKGDNLTKIAKANGLTLAEIKKLNTWCKAPFYIVPVGAEVRIK